ncbi:MAG: hypothetical protein WCK35_15160 [Chloroflexota bacterium]
MLNKATKIITGLLKSRSARFSDIARAMPGEEAGNYKLIHRFLETFQVKKVLLRMFNKNAEFLIGDPAEMPWPQAKHTA